MPGLNIQQHISLKPYNTFGIDVTASEFVELKSVEEAKVLCRTFNLADRKLLILGGGSNVLLTQNVQGMVICNRIKGIELINETETHAMVKAMSGEVWHELVMWTIEHGLGGLENLSLIPGCVGAAPMQNIGAYGAEVRHTIVDVEAIRLSDGVSVIFSNQECRFGYRESIFKQEAKGKYLIVSVTFQLLKNPVFNTTYGAIQQTLEKNGITHPTLRDISNAVIAIRSSKLPDPKKLGNAGSFFKNPEIPGAQFQQLKDRYPGIVGYPAQQNTVKVSAGWLIEQCGWKGKQVGNVGSHKDQALVLVNYGGATGSEIWNLAMDIRKSVGEKFGIDIQPEVNII